MPICTSCGRENPAGARFCSFCAEPLESAGPSRELRKTVTVVFCDVSGSTALGERLDPEALRRVMARYFQVMRAVLERHGGTVEKFIGDAVMAVFGVPVLHEDDALRAVRAAAEMQKTMAALNEELERDHGTSLELRIGVNTGEVVTGTEERLATGDSVNVASRLEQAARPGEILLGPETLRLVSAAVEVELLPPLELKGKQAPLDAARLLTVLDTIETRPGSPFVGRVLERRLLADAWGRVSSQRCCHLFTVLGAPGVGKSRLVSEFTGGLKATVANGRCLSYGEGITYSPVVEVVTQLSAGRPPADLSTDPAARAALGVLLGDETMPSSPEEIAWAVRKLLETEAEAGPLVVVLDDLQWGDPPFLDLVEHVAVLSRSAPILLLCMARPELLHRRPGWGSGKMNATTVHLEPLSPAETDVLIDGLAAAASLDERVRARILDRAEGNPLFVEQMLAMLDEGSDGGLDLPPSIRALLAARLDQLDTAERRVLECGAVEGEVFHRGAVQALTPDDPTATAQLTALVRKELVRPERALIAGDDAFRFQHALIRDAAYDALAKASRAELHERFADWLEQHGSELVEVDEVVGYHLEQAVRYRGELGPMRGHERLLAARAAERLSRAGRRALARADIAAAAALLGRAVALIADEPNVSLRIDLTGALWGMGDVRAAEDVLAEIARLTAAAGDGCGQTRARLYRAELAVQTGRQQLFDLEALADQAVSLFEQEQDDAGLLQALLTRARIGSFRARWQGVVSTNVRALDVAHRLGDVPQETQILAGIAGAQFWGHTPYDEVLGFLEQHPMLQLRPVVVYVRGQILARRGSFEAARALTREMRARMAELGFPAGEYFWEWSLETLAGDHAAAERAARAGCTELEARGENSVRSTLACLLALSLCELGRFDEAQEWAELGASIGTPGDAATEIYSRMAVARVLVARDRAGEAERVAREAVALADATDVPTDQAGARAVLAETLAAAGKTAGAVRALERAAALGDAKGDLVTPPRMRARIEELRASAG